MILGLIPARGGSKRIKNKNLRLLKNLPLIWWSIEAGLRSKRLDCVVVSTDDDAIAGISAGFGAKVLKRPASLATDDATTISVLQHAVEELDPDVVVLLQPTSPIRPPGLIDRAIKQFFDSEADTLATGFISYQYAWATMPNMPQQKMKGFFYDDGNVYVHRAAHLRRGEWWGERLWQMMIGPEYNIEIDTEADFWAAEGILARL